MTVNMKAPLEIGISVKDVDRAADFYERVLGMKAGDRPPFPFPGAATPRRFARSRS